MGQNSQLNLSMIGTKKILIVEDDPFVAMDLEQCVLSIPNTSVVKAFDSENAMNLIKTESFDLFLLDIQLNKRHDGIELAQFIQLELAKPFLFITALTDSMTLLKAANCIPRGFIIKPYNSETLVANVKLALINDVLHKPIMKSFLNPENSIQSKKVLKAIKFINDNVSKPLSTQDVADYVDWDRSHLSRIFKQEVHISLKEYMLSKKIELAVELIHQNKYKLMHISELVGFDTYASFITAFQKQIGILPREYLALCSE